MLSLIAVDILVLATNGVHARQVTMCTLNWRAYYGADLPRNGLFTAIVRTAFERGGHSSRTGFMLRARAMLEVKKGDRDVLLGAYYNDERAETYIASDPIYTDEVGIVAHEDLGLTEFDSLRKLSKYTIGCGRDCSVNKAFASAGYPDKDPEETQVLNLRKLFEGQIDLIAGSFTRTRYVVNQQEYNTHQLVFLEPPVTEDTLHIMVSRGIDDGVESIEDFHQGLTGTREDGTYDQIYTKMGCV